MSKLVKVKSNNEFLYIINWSFEEDTFNDVTILRLYGYDRHKKSTMIRIEDFTIFCYLELPTDINWVKYASSLSNCIKEKFKSKPLKMELEMKKRLYNAEYNKVGDKYEQVLFPFLKVSFATFSKMRDFIGQSRGGLYIAGLGKITVNVHCGNNSLTPSIRFIDMFDIPSTGWVKLENVTNVDDLDKETNKQREFIVKHSNITRVPENLVTKLPIIFPCILSFDIETYSSKLVSMPDANLPQDEVFQIGCTFRTIGGKIIKYILTLKECDDIDDVIVIRCKSERILLTDFAKLVREHDPDIIIGYNIYGFDYQYIIRRAELKKCVNEFMQQSCINGRVCQKGKIEWESSAFGVQELTFVDAEGRLIFDMLPYMKRSFKLANYRLETVCDEFLKTNKDPLKYRDIFECYEKGDGKSMALCGKYCLAEGTNVSLRYRSERIEQLVDSSNKILSFSEQSNGFVYSNQTKFFNNGQKECLEITMIDGTKIICTDDHKFLLSNGQWKEAKNIDKEDMIKGGLVFPNISLEQEYEECKDDDFIMFKINNKEDMEKGYAFARVLGYLLTDGHISKDRCVLYVGSLIDAKDIIEDIKILTNNTQEIKNHINAYKISLPIELRKIIVSLENITTGKRTLQDTKLPDIVKTWKKPFIREFLGGLFGGGGHTCCFSKDHNKFTSIAFSQTRLTTHIDSLKIFLEDIQKMLELFGVKSSIGQPKLLGGSNNEHSSLELRVCQTSTITFEDLIGFRFCYHKSLRLRIANIHQKIRKHKIDTYNNFLDDIKKYLIIENCSKSKAYDETKKNYNIDLPSKKLINKKFNEGFNYDFHFTNGIERYRDDFLKIIGAYEFFCSNNSKTYATKKDCDAIPSFHIPVSSIKKVGIKNVYDIEVKDTHNYLANGIVAHNCTQDSYVVYLLFDKLHVWYDITESANTNQVPMFFLYAKGQQIKMYSQVFAYCYHNNVVMNVPRDLLAERYTGATVLNPIPGIYKNIIPFDFASLYPSIIMAYNIDYTTYISNNQIADEDCDIMKWQEHANCEHDPKMKPIKRKKDATDEDEKKYQVREEKREQKKICKEFHHKFAKASKVGKGVIPTIIESLLTARKQVRKKLEIVSHKHKIITLYLDKNINEEQNKELRENEEFAEIYKLIKDDTEQSLAKLKQVLSELDVQKSVLDKRQLAYKVNANSMYGALGAAKGYLPFVNGAMTITYIGRISIEKAVNYIRKNWDDALVVYGDTDSCFINFKRFENHTPELFTEIWKFAENVVDKIKEIFPAPMKLEFEGKIYATYFILSKKRYIAQPCDINGVMDKQLYKKGVVLQRRDNCKFLKDIYEHTLWNILNNAEKLRFENVDIKDILRHPVVSKTIDEIIEYVNDLFRFKYTAKDFVITKGLNRVDYVGKRKPAHASLADKLGKRGITVPVNTRLEYVLINLDKKDKLQEDIIEEFGYFKEHKDILRIDYFYYLEHQVMKPIDEILNVAFKIPKFMDTHVKLRLNKLSIQKQLRTIFSPKVEVINEEEKKVENPIRLLLTKKKPVVHSLSSLYCFAKNDEDITNATVVDHNNLDIIEVYHDLLSDMTLVKDEENNRYVIKTKFENSHSDAGKLMSFVAALRIASKMGYKEIYLDSNLIITWWSKGKVRKETLDKMDEVKKKYLQECIELRKKYEEKGGKIIKICEDDNKAKF